MTNEATPGTGLSIEDHGSSLVIRLAGGPHQVFGPELVRQLESLVERAEADPKVHAVVFTSAHASRFMSHADVGWLQKGGLEFVERQRAGAAAPPLPKEYVGLDRLHALFLRMNNAGVVFVAALEGPALGLGAEFAWACDLRVMADAHTFLGQPEVLLGIMPGGGGTQRLTRLVGAHRALVAIMQGKPLSPAEALAICAVDAVVPREHVVAKSLELARQLGRRHKAALAAIKRAVYFGGSLPLPDGIKLEAREFVSLVVADVGQQRMIGYQTESDALGELPLYATGGYDAAVEAGQTPVGTGGRGQGAEDQMTKQSGYASTPNEYVTIRGRRIAWRSVGEGRPLVLCVRFRGTMDSWDPAFIDALARSGFRVVTFDYPGLGLSEGTPDYSPATLAGDARDLIQALGLADVVIGGWSLGGLAAQVFVARFPELASDAVLIATGPPGPNVKGAEQLFNDTARKVTNDLEDEIVLFFEPRSARSREAARRSHARISWRQEGRCPDVPVDFARGVLGETPRVPLFPATPVLHALQHTSVRLLHLGADHDIAFPIENWYALSGTIPTLHLVTLPDTGHAPHHQYPELAAAHIAAFCLAPGEAQRGPRVAGGTAP